MPKNILDDLKRHPIIIEYDNVSLNIYLIYELEEEEEEHDLWSELIGKENTRDDIIAPVKLTRDCCLSAPSFNPNSLPITDTLYGKVEWGENNIDSNW